jgi:hypothetical protein
MINALIIDFDDQGDYLQFRDGAEGTRTPEPHTASVVPTAAVGNIVTARPRIRADVHRHDEASGPYAIARKPHLVSSCAPP